jgi:hypothetical protein
MNQSCRRVLHDSNSHDVPLSLFILPSSDEGRQMLHVRFPMDRERLLSRAQEIQHEGTFHIECKQANCEN